ncbi:MAG: PilZ domain-containing protein [Myxococcota bacterium]
MPALREQRAYARVAFPCQVVLWVGNVSHDVVARDLSRGGAFLYCPLHAAELGERVVARLHDPCSGTAFGLPGKVVRVDTEAGPHNGGQHGLAIQWLTQLMSEEDVSQLDRLLECLLAQEGGARRAHARLSVRLAVVYRTDAETSAVLRDISRGGCSIEVDSALPKDTRVEVRVTAPPALGVTLTGRIRYCRALNDGRWQAGVKLDELPLQVQQTIATLLKKLVGTPG